MSPGLLGQSRIYEFIVQTKLTIIGNIKLGDGKLAGLE